MKNILLTLEAGSLEEECMTFEATRSSTQSLDCPSTACEETLVISGSITISP